MDSANLYHFIGGLRPLILKINIEMTMVVMVIVLLIFFLSGILCFNNYDFTFLWSDFFKQYKRTDTGVRFNTNPVLH